MKYNSNEIQDILPHRFPFQLIDKVIDGEEGKWAKGIKCVSVNEAHFCGHFPNKHVMPGVLIIEAMAQLGAVVLLSKEENKGKIAYFAGIKNAKFRGVVQPGDVVEMTCTLIRDKGKFGLGEAKALVDDKVVCSAEIMFAIQK